MSLIIRRATPDDAAGMVQMMNRIITTGGTTAHLNLFDTDRMIRHYIAPPRVISCHTALLDDTIVGFQELEWCDPEWDGPGKLPADWAVIATFVDAAARGKGVGKALFAATHKSAQKVQVTSIDATIRADNALGLAYYSAMGFTDYSILNDLPLSDGTKVDRLRKRLDL